jgi:hypothetical protein
MALESVIIAEEDVVSAPDPMRTVGQMPPDGIRPGLIVRCTGGPDHEESRDLLRAVPATAPDGEPWLVAMQIPRRAGEQRHAPEAQRARDGHLYYDLPCPSCRRSFRCRVRKLAGLLAEYRAHRSGQPWVIDLADPAPNGRL